MQLKARNNLFIISTLFPSILCINLLNNVK